MLPASAPAAIFTLNPTLDAFVSSANPTSNYGGAGALVVSASGLPKGEFDSLLQFNLAAAKASFDTTFGAGLWAINSMSLQLTLVVPNNVLFNGNGAGSGGTNVNFAGNVTATWLQNDSWTEGTGTPAAPGVTGIASATLASFRSGADEPLGSFAFPAATSGNTSLALGLTASFVADASAGNPVSLLLLPGDSGVATVTSSKSGASAPVLTVSAIAVPEPCAGMLGLAGVLGWSARRRRHARTA